MLDECFRNSTYSAVHGMAKFGASFASLHRRFATAGFVFSASRVSITIVGKSFGVFTGSTHSTKKIIRGHVNNYRSVHFISHISKVIEGVFGGCVFLL